LSPISYPTAASPLVSLRMSRNPRVNTRAELRIRSAVHSRGLRFRVDLPISCANLTVRPDIVFPRPRLAVFVDGCFWHSCPSHGTAPQRNTEYWARKLERNRIRDAMVAKALGESGWQVLRIWEHVSVSVAADEIASRVAASTPRRHC
jgi:DNA mismatch endonuclease (patch repair protein)